MSAGNIVRLSLIGLGLGLALFGFEAAISLGWSIYGGDPRYDAFSSAAPATWRMFLIGFLGGLVAWIAAAWWQTVHRTRYRPNVWLWWFVWGVGITRVLAEFLFMESFEVSGFGRDEFGFPDYPRALAKIAEFDPDDAGGYAVAATGWWVLGLVAMRALFKVKAVPLPDVSVERGAKIADAKEARRKLRGGDAPGPRRPLGRRLFDGLLERSRPATTARAAARGGIELAGVPIPAAAETKHLWMMGSTGSGKTQALMHILDAIRERGGRAVVADSGGELWSRYGDPARDVLLNPLDARSVQWSPFLELRESYDPERIALAAIPHSPDSASWSGFAQNLFAESLRELDRSGQRSMRELLRFLFAADTAELKAVIGHTTAAGSLASERTLGGIRTQLGPSFGAWRELADPGDFSVREWVSGGDGGSGWLFLTYRDDQMAMLRHLVGAWLELALVEALSLTEDDDRQLWFIMDEIDSLGRVSSLDTALSKLRKYGGRCVVGCQSIAQLRSTYGRDTAQTIAANTGTKLTLRSGDHETAEYCSRELGEQEIERVTETVSGPQAVLARKTRGGRLLASIALTPEGGTAPQVSSSQSIQHVKRAAVMPADLMNLPDLEGYLSVAGLPEIVKIVFKHRHVERRLPAYVSPRDAARDGSLAAGQAAGAGALAVEGGGSESD